jgi:transposase
MEEISVIGIDVAKRVMQVCGLSASGEVLLQKRVGRAGFMRFMEKAPRVLVGLEAAGGAYYWAWWLAERGYPVKLVLPRIAKRYRSGVHKNDLRDAYAVAEAASRKQIAGVAIKSPEALALQAMARVRRRRVQQLGQTTSQLRGLLYEHGIVLPKGTSALLKRLAELQGSATFAAVPELLRWLTCELVEEIEEQRRRVDKVTRELKAAVRRDADCVRSMTIPCIGPINAASLAVALDVPSAYRSGRAFAAALRLVPTQYSSGEENRLGGIARMRRSEVRSNLVMAAQSLLNSVAKQTDPKDPFLRWAKRLLARKPRNVAVIAVAHKLARIAWALAVTNQPYRMRPSRGSAAALPEAA